MTLCFLYATDGIRKHIIHDKMVSYAKASARSTDDAENYVIMNGKPGYLGYSSVHLSYLKDGWISLVGDNVEEGTSAAQYYPEPYRRSMGDIDFLVPQNLYERAKEIMEANEYSYEYGDTENSCHIGYRKNGVLFELHRSISSVGRDIEPLVLEGFQRREIHFVYGNGFPTLPEPINGLVFLAHIRQHMFEEGIGLRHIIDWMMFVHKYLTDEKWENDFKILTKHAGFTTFAKTLTLMCKLYLGLPDDVPWCEDADPAVAEELMHYVLRSGNFGCKNKKKKSERQVEVVARNIRTMGMFAYLQKKGELHWKTLEICPYLIPFAWTFQLRRIVKSGIWSGLKIRTIRKNMIAGKETGILLEKLGIE